VTSRLKGSGVCSSGPWPTSPPPTSRTWPASSSGSWRRSSTGRTWSSAAYRPPDWPSMGWSTNRTSPVQP